MQAITEYECPYCLGRYTEHDLAAECCLKVDVYYKCPLCDWESLHAEDFIEHVEESHREAQTDER